VLIHHLSFLPCLFILVSCTTSPPETNVGNHSAPSTDITRFENRLAEKLLHLAFVEIKEADEDDKLGTIEFHLHRIEQGIDFSRLSKHNQLQIRLLDKVLISTRIENATAESKINQLIRDSSPGLDGEAVRQLAKNRVEKLKIGIQLLASTDRELNLTSLFDSIRQDPDNYLPDTEAGRQEYLTLMVDKLVEMEALLPLFLDLPAHKELNLMGFNNPDSIAIPVFNYDRGTTTLEVDLTDITQLPRFEIESAALFYGVPGLHTISSFREMFEIQSLAELPAYSNGWAAYMNSMLDRIPLYQHPTGVLERSYSELFFTALAIVDYSINSQGQSDDVAVEFLIRNSPYPTSRIKRSLQLTHQFPGLYLGQFLGLLEFEALHNFAEESLGGNFDLVEFHSYIVELGPLPFTELRVLLEQWVDRSRI